MAEPASSGGELQQAMEQVAATPGIVGAIAGAYVDGRAAGVGTAGSRWSGGHGGAIPADSRFRIGSQTKAMVATALLRLVDRNQLGLEDTLATWLPEVDGLVERADEITVRQLIQHTSGVPDWYSSPGSTTPLFDVFDFTTYYPPLEVVATTRGLPRTGEPGERFTYSNTGYTLLGMVVEKVTGHSLAHELHRSIFRPLGMTRTYQTTRPPEGIVGPHGHGYFPDATGTLRDVHRLNASWANGAGGVVSTTRDVSAFQRALQQGRLLPPALQEVLLGGPQPEGRRGGCADELRIFGGTAPGYVALTFTSTDGRKQIAVSVTRSTVDDLAVIDAIVTAVEPVFCPGE